MKQKAFVKLEKIENKHLYLLERLDFIRMNAESLDFQDMHVIAEEIEMELKLGKRFVKQLFKEV